MNPKERLGQEYLEFLSRYGLSPSSAQKMLDPASYQAMMDSALPGAAGSSILEQLKKTIVGHITENNLHKQNVNYSQAIITEQAETIESEATTSGIGSPMFSRIFAGEFPTGEINAMAVRVPSGFLALINLGLVEFIERMCHIAITRALGDGQPGEEVPKPVIDADTVAITRYQIAAYLRSTEAFAPPRVDVDSFKTSLSGAVMYSVLKNTCLRFVLAHEYGHVLMGHLDNPNDPVYSASTPVGEVPIIRKAWDREYEADVTGLMLLLGIGDRKQFVSKYGNFDKKVMAPLTIAAPVFFFSLAALIERILVLKGQLRSYHPSDCSHPPGAARAGMMINYLNELLPDDFDYFYHGRMILEWSAALTVQVLPCFTSGSRTSSSL